MTLKTQEFPGARASARPIVKGGKLRQIFTRAPRRDEAQALREFSQPLRSVVSEEKFPTAHMVHVVHIIDQIDLFEVNYLELHGLSSDLWKGLMNLGLS
jgi:hypothetical protein